MKKISLYLLLAICLVSSCKKDDAPLFNQSSEERLTETLAAYQTKLTGAQYGWKATLYPAGGGVFSFYFKFNDSNRVQMLSDFDSASAVTFRESSYRLKALQQPSILFDTYSYIHVLSDPNETVAGGVRGEGLVSDFEFYFDTSTVDSIKLVGRFHGSKATLVRATAAEATGFNTGQLANGLYVNKILTYFKRLTIGAQLFDIQVDPLSRTFTFSYLNASGALETFATTYYLTVSGISFSTPLVAGGQTISSFTNMSWDQASETINMQVNGTVSTITGIVVPLKVDLQAPQDWWNWSADNDDYWITLNGFHVNGVDDAFNLASIPGYNGASLFWAKFTTTPTGITYDYLSPIVGNAIYWGAAYRPPTFTADGRIVFSYLGTRGTVPPAANSSYTAFRTKFGEPGGFYLVKIDNDGLVYDMVSATDGKSWVRWER